MWPQMFRRLIYFTCNLVVSSNESQQHLLDGNCTINAIKNLCIRVDWYLNAGVAFSNLRLTLCMMMCLCCLIFRFSISKCGNWTPFRRVKMTCFGFVVLRKIKTWPKLSHAFTNGAKHSWLLLKPQKYGGYHQISQELPCTMMITKYLMYL